MTTGTREYNGYYQVLNEFSVPDGQGGYKTEKRWQYVVAGFGDTTASMMLWGGGYVTHHIDKDNKITLRTGQNKYRKFGPKFWHH